MAQEILKLSNISKTFPGVKALNGIQFSLNAGEVHCICGENGAGKSTLIKIPARTSRIRTEPFILRGNR